MTLANGTRRDVLELDYTRLNIGVINANIAWRYSSQTCQPSVFTIEGYTSINSTSTEIRVPTNTIQHNITTGALYLRLLAHDESGNTCAQDSAAWYYRLDNISEETSLSVCTIMLSLYSLCSYRLYSSIRVPWECGVCPHSCGSLLRA